MKLYPHTVINDFYDDPDAIRRFALAQNYQFLTDRPDTPYVYPGSRSKDIFDLDQQLHATICKKLVSVFHIQEHDLMRWAISTNFQSVTKAYNRGVIHTDSNTIFAGVLFLSPDAPLDAGTSLFKQNKSFTYKKYREALRQNEHLFRSGDVTMRTDYHSMFDEVLRVNNVYNSLVIYEGDTFHAANAFFGETLADSRLTQVFFINKIDANKASSFPLNRLKAIPL